MPVYMDRHDADGQSQHDIALAHLQDLELQEQFGVKMLTYWFDETRGAVFCMADAPHEHALQQLHEASHGGIPSKIIKVDPMLAQSFLGQIEDPVPSGTTEETADQVKADSAFRAIVFTDLQGSTDMTVRLGDAKAMHLLRIHNTLTRDALESHNGREVKHTGDGFMISFVSASDAVECAVAIQKAFAAYNKEHPVKTMHVRIGLSAGEPVQEDGDLFGVAVQLAARLCAHAKPDCILAAQMVQEQCKMDQLFAVQNEMTPKGFVEPVPVYEVQWQATS